MPIIFTHPAGFLALIGIPVIIAIHFLQRQSQSLPISTLFLLDAIDRQSLKGRKLDRLRNSIPLWLQLLCVLLLTWLLVQPRWTATGRTHRVVVVLDSSASMEPFKEDVAAALQREVAAILPAGSDSLLTMMESLPQGGRLYRGSSITDMIDTIRDWSPSDSAHSPETSLRVGRSIAGSDGTLIFLTDQIGDPPAFGASHLSVGRPIENVGFTGLSTDSRKSDAGEEEIFWRASVKNYTPTSQERQWFLTSGKQRTEGRSLALAAGESRILSGKFPTNGDRITLVLESDEFTRDDQLFIVVPKPKPLSVANAADESTTDLIRSILLSLENTQVETGPVQMEKGSGPDLAFATYNPLSPDPLPPVGIVFLNQESVPREFLKGTLVPENHPLMEGLNWQGLIAKLTPSIPMMPEDMPLLWQGDRVLIFLRNINGSYLLVFNFDVLESNASRLPSFIVLINRFADQIRRAKVASESINLELNQPLDLSVYEEASAPGLVYASPRSEERIPASQARNLRAPRRPGFFEIMQGEELLTTGAANFQDSREADFSNAGSQSELSERPQEVLTQQSVIDPLWQLWVILLIILLFSTWYHLSRPAQVEAASIAQPE